MAEEPNPDSPLALVAREMTLHSRMSEDEVYENLSDVLDELHFRASHAIITNDGKATAYAKQYQAVSEALNAFGGMLAAVEDIRVSDGVAN